MEFRVKTRIRIGDVEDDNYSEGVLDKGLTLATGLKTLLLVLSEKLADDVVYIEVDTLSVLDLKHPDIGIDGMTPDLWNGMTKKQRHHWTKLQHSRGQFSFCCIDCGFPTQFSTAGCESCRPDLHGKKVEAVTVPQ